MSLFKSHILGTASYLPTFAARSAARQAPKRDDDPAHDQDQAPAPVGHNKPPLPENYHPTFKTIDECGNELHAIASDAYKGLINLNGTNVARVSVAAADWIYIQLATEGKFDWKNDKGTLEEFLRRNLVVSDAIDEKDVDVNPSSTISRYIKTAMYTSRLALDGYVSIQEVNGVRRVVAPYKDFQPMFDFRGEPHRNESTTLKPVPAAKLEALYKKHYEGAKLTKYGDLPKKGETVDANGEVRPNGQQPAAQQAQAPAPQQQEGQQAPEDTRTASQRFADEEAAKQQQQQEAAARVSRSRIKRRSVWCTC